MRFLTPFDAAQGLWSRATATTAIGTSLTAVTGLSISVGLGTWRYTAWVPGVVVGAPTNIAINVAATGNPITSAHIQMHTRRSTTTSSVTRHTSFGSTSSTTFGAAAGDYLAAVEGTCVVTTAGAITISLIRTGGTSFTTDIGSFLYAERITP